MSHPTTTGAVPWPAHVAADYRAMGYWEDRTLGSILRAVAHEQPGREALVDGDVRLTYDQLMDRADAAAARLRRLGFEPDDRLLVQLPNCWQFVVLLLACFRAGVIPVMALPAHRRYELTYLASLSECKGIVVPATLHDFDHQALAHELVDEVPDLDTVLVLGRPTGDARDLDGVVAAAAGGPAVDAPVAADSWEPDPDSPACLLISGGTTGLPKLIARTHNDYLCNIRATSATAALSDRDVYLLTLPASHNFSLACPGILGILVAGGKAVLLPSPEPRRAFRTIRQEGVTISATVPAVAQRWLEHQELTGGNDLATLRVLQVGGSRLPDVHAWRIRPVLGCTLQQSYGMAEGLISTTRLDDPDDVICTTQGRPVHEADEIRVLGPSGEDVPTGHSGALLTRGPYTPRGYYNAPEHNAIAFLDGWFSSGDVVTRRRDGNLVVEGRSKDMINRGGEKISAHEIESLVYKLPGVDLTAAVAMPDPMLGERMCLFVVMKQGQVYSLEQIRTHLSNIGIARHKLPERLEVASSLPTTQVGKIDKKALRDDLASRLELAEP